MTEKTPPLTPPRSGEGLTLVGLGLWVLFLLVLAIWTWKLLEPTPVPASVTNELSDQLKFVLSKCLHAGAYAFLTVLAYFLPMRRPYFWLVVGLLALHGVGTEIGQTYVPSRSGSVRDVLIDSLGIGLGILTLRRVPRLLGRTSSPLSPAPPD